jgi:hypothetical protein
VTFEEFKEKFITWLIENIEPVNKETGFPICPYAKQARLKEKIQFIHIQRGIYGEFLDFNPDIYEIGIAWLDENTIYGIEDELADLRKYNKDLLYYLSTPTSGFFAQNFSNCVFIQKRKDIDEKRKYLKNTKYYDNWPEWYYNEIVNGF